jgi:hypothetical protein
MNRFFNTANKHILIKDLNDTVDFNLINSQFEKLTFKQNVVNEISTNINFFDTPEMADIKKTLEFECEEYLKNGHGIDQFEKLGITYSWGNITVNGVGHHSHTHPFSIVSGVIFIDDNPDNLKLCLETYVSDIPYFWYKSKSSIAVRELINEDTNLKNHLVLFLSNQEHFVEESSPNAAPRRTLSFNTFWKGQVGATDPGLGSYTFK